VFFRHVARLIDAWRAVSRVGRTTWRALPGDLLGLLVMRGCGIAAPTRTVDAGDVSALLIEDPRVGRWFRFQVMPIRAQTLGRYVFAREAVPADILAHECEHVRQWQRFGPLFLPLYFAASAVALGRGNDGYGDNRFEAAARARAERDTEARNSRAAADENLTKAVRYRPKMRRPRRARTFEEPARNADSH
jgi:hypothetical protein